MHPLKSIQIDLKLCRIQTTAHNMLSINRTKLNEQLGIGIST